MPFCTKCGHEARPVDRFCRKCGSPQPGGAPGAPDTGPKDGATGESIGPRGASILCYIPWFGWLAAVWVLATDRFRSDRDVRFHAYQGLYLFVVWMLSHWAIGLWFQLFLDDFPPIWKLLELAVLGLWIFMLVKTSNGERYSLPVIGELAERSLDPGQ